MSSIEALEAHLRTDPDDEEAWLVYGDWLSEQGDVRGQLVALRHRLTSGEPGDEERRSIEAKMGALHEAHEAEWLGGWVPPSTARLQWRCGFVHGIRLRQRTELPEALIRLRAAPAGRLLGKLGLDGSRLGASGAEAMLGPDAGASVFGTLVEVDLSSNGLGDRGAKILARAARSGAFRSLAALSLYCNAMGPDAARALAEAELLSSVSALDLSYNALGGEGAEALAESLAGDSSLSALGLWGCVLGDAGAMALARADDLGPLRSLTLCDNAIGDAGAIALAGSSALRGLQLLDLSDNPIGPRGAGALAQAGADVGCTIRLS